jgi:hypothetical protein
MEERAMDQPTRSGIMDALENIAAELERLRVLKEHELSVHIKKEAPGGSGPLRGGSEARRRRRIAYSPVPIA